MKSMLEMQGSLFLYILIGIYAQKRGIITYANRRKITDLIIDIILPCNIINSFMISGSNKILLQCGAVFLLSMVAQIGYVLASKLLFRHVPRDKQAILRYAIICSNAGFLGNPIVESVFGAKGLLFASVALIPLRFAMWSSGLSLFTKTDKKSTVKVLITHPCILAVFLGFGLMLSQLQLPGFVLKTISGVGGCNTAISMIVIGSILAEINIKEIMDLTLFYYAAIRLVAIPVVVLVLFKIFNVDALITGVIVLLSAMPAGSTTVMLAEKYNGDSEYATSCVFLSTILSLVTIPLISYLII